MSTAATKWAWQQLVKGPAKSVLVCIAWHAQADGHCRVSIATLAEDCGISYRATRYAVARLLSLHLIGAVRLPRHVTTYQLIGAPHAPGTTHSVLPGAPHAPKNHRSTQAQRDKDYNNAYSQGYQDGKAGR